MTASERIEWLTAYTLALVSASAASLYGLMSAAGLFGWVKGAGLFGVAFVGCHGPAWIAKAYRRLGWTGALFGMLVTAICFGATLLGGLGTNAGGGAELQASRISARDTAKNDRAELERISKARTALGSPAGDAATVKAAADAVATAARNRVAECGPNNETRGRFCKAREADEAKARADLKQATENKAAADAAKRLDAERAAILKRQQANGPAAVDIDPQASAFAQLTGMTVATSAAAIAFWLSLAFELAAMFALMIAYSNEGGARFAVPATQETEQQARPMPGNVSAFFAACLPHDATAETDMRAIFDRYKAWCAESKPALAPLPADLFGRQFGAECKRHGVAVRRDGKSVLCVGVRLVA